MADFSSTDSVRIELEFAVVENVVADQPVEEQVHS